MAVLRDRDKYIDWLQNIHCFAGLCKSSYLPKVVCKITLSTILFAILIKSSHESVSLTDESGWLWLMGRGTCIVCKLAKVHTKTRARGWKKMVEERLQSSDDHCFLSNIFHAQCCVKISFPGWDAWIIPRAKPQKHKPYRKYSFVMQLLSCSDDVFLDNSQWLDFSHFSALLLVTGTNRFASFALRFCESLKFSPSGDDNLDRLYSVAAHLTAQKTFKLLCCFANSGDNRVFAWWMGSGEKRLPPATKSENMFRSSRRELSWVSPQTRSLLWSKQKEETLQTGRLLSRAVWSARPVYSSAAKRLIPNTFLVLMADR